MKKRFAPFTAWPAVAALLLAACVKKPDSPPPPSDPERERVENVSDLKIVSFSVTPEHNERIYGRVDCTPDDRGVRWSGSVVSYRADLTGLIAEFDMVADRVTVGNVEQTSGVTANDFTSPVVYRLYTCHGEYREFTVVIDNPEDSYTGFPLLAVMTDGEEPVTSREEWIPGRMVIDAQQGDCEEYSGRISIKGRGNNTWMRDKKPYAVKLEEKSPLMGMNRHKRWVLLANSLDKTLLRNRVAFEIGKRTGLSWTPDSRFVDVMLNGRFLGSYLLCEQIRVDENRVDIAEAEEGMAPEEVGYLLEMDRYYDEINKFRSAWMDLPVNIKEPDEDVLSAAQKAYITGYINDIERMLYEGDIDGGYRDMLDMDTFIDWWMVIELTGNRDARLPGSCYFYKDAGGRLCAGPLWDFDLSTFRAWQSFLLYGYTIYPSEATGTDRSLWYGRLFEDPVFKARAKERWMQFRDAFGRIDEFVNAEAEKIAVSARRNWEIWTIDSGPNHDEGLPWEEAVEAMKANYALRLQWLDRQIMQW